MKDFSPKIFSEWKPSKANIVRKSVCLFEIKEKLSQKLVVQGSQMPCPFTGPKIFWAGPNILCQTKN